MGFMLRRRIGLVLLAFPLAVLAQDPVAVRVMRSQPVGAHHNLELPGNVVPYEKASLFAQVTGYLEDVRVNIGDRVHENQVLAKLTIPEMEPELKLAQAEVAAARARVHEAEANHALAKVTSRRFMSLREAEPGAVTSQDLDVTAAKEKLAAAHLEIAHADLEVAEARVVRLTALMQYATIRAPFEGVVTARFADSGALAVANDTDSRPILEVARTDRLRLQIDIPEAYVPYIEEGRKVEFAIDIYPGRNFESVISRVSGVLAADTRSMRAEIDLDGGEGHIRPGMYATVSLSLAEMPLLRAFPADALRTIAGRTVIFVARDGRAVGIPVAILMDDGEQVVVAGDFYPDMAVIVSGPVRLEPGQPVVIEGRP